MPRASVKQHLAALRELCQRLVGYRWNSAGFQRRVPHEPYQRCRAYQLRRNAKTFDHFWYASPNPSWC